MALGQQGGGGQFRNLLGRFLNAAGGGRAGAKLAEIELAEKLRIAAEERADERRKRLRNEESRKFNKRQKRKRQKRKAKRPAKKAKRVAKRERQRGAIKKAKRQAFQSRQRSRMSEITARLGGLDSEGQDLINQLLEASKAKSAMKGKPAVGLGSVLDRVKAMEITQGRSDFERKRNLDEESTRELIGQRDAAKRLTEAQIPLVGTSKPRSTDTFKQLKDLNGVYQAQLKDLMTPEDFQEELDALSSKANTQEELDALKANLQEQYDAEKVLAEELRGKIAGVNKQMEESLTGPEADAPARIPTVEDAFDDNPFEPELEEEIVNAFFSNDADRDGLHDQTGLPMIPEMKRLRPGRDKLIDSLAASYYGVTQ